MTAHRIPAAAFIAVAALAQSPDAPDWQIAAGGSNAFDAASVKPFAMKSFPRPPSFPLDDGNAKPPGGRLYVVLPILTFIGFAWKLNISENAAIIAQLPGWAKDEIYEIEARAGGNPTKDQMRLMMQSLLADRFKLAVHFETREAPVFALTLVKPGQTGPNLRPHSEGPPCPDSYTTPVFPPPAPTATDVFPANCDTIEMKGNGVRALMGGRNLTMSRIAEVVYSEASRAGEVDRPVMDRSGLTGTFDFTFETTPIFPVANPQPDQPPTSTLAAIRRELGLKLERSRGPIRTLIIDHIEKPSEN
jgi:bla regulator protein blaR1